VVKSSSLSELKDEVVKVIERRYGGDRPSRRLKGPGAGAKGGGPFALFRFDR